MQLCQGYAPRGPGHIMARYSRPKWTFSNPLALANEWRFVANRKPLMLRFIVRAVPGWSHRLAWPRTEPSQGLNTGSNPVGTTTPSSLMPAAILNLIVIVAAG
ncbi:hypothetical protein COMA2_30196 [Candidatus Nitrospira nitrificans]|uniref:Uncharacterized protein n=1 Tax=Candidatus Nitrospira nitrificans TaxID=1742973 RepID=A0A0S4LMZ1_9BACT|nr:hypothetical protein COMA2_30196 [Candidatus Nitrospira nitrificans]